MEHRPLIGSRTPWIRLPVPGLLVLDQVSRPYFPNRTAQSSPKPHAQLQGFQQSTHRLSKTDH
ncbi:DUF3732 domain-containing protein [Paraburkholderia sediminicola]|uniref:DUF3732 domain-containing protein n=1 Tax=Paraburkholderia sediminicola TaxID=458836 RepID=UPI0038B77EB4